MASNYEFWNRDELYGKRKSNPACYLRDISV